MKYGPCDATQQSINKLSMITVDYLLGSYLNENFKSSAMQYMDMDWS